MYALILRTLEPVWVILSVVNQDACHCAADAPPRTLLHARVIWRICADGSGPVLNGVIDASGLWIGSNTAAHFKVLANGRKILVPDNSSRGKHVCGMRYAVCGMRYWRGSNQASSCWSRRRRSHAAGPLYGLLVIAAEGPSFGPGLLCQQRCIRRSPVRETMNDGGFFLRSGGLRLEPVSGMRMPDSSALMYGTSRATSATGGAI